MPRPTIPEEPTSEEGDITPGESPSEEGATTPTKIE